MAARTMHLTGYLVCQFLLVLLIPVAMLISLVNTLLLQLQRQLQRLAEQPVHIHYEVHQHVHLNRPTAYQEALDQVSQHLPVPLQRVRSLPAQQTIQIQPNEQPERKQLKAFF
jgi:hypothetical protein